MSNLEKFGTYGPKVLTGLQAFKVVVSQKTIWVLLRLDFESGVHGWGEATHFGSEQQIGLLATRLQKSLSDNPAFGLPDLINRTLQSDMSGARGAFASALAQAWYDGLGQFSGVPAHCLLGGAERDQVPFYANINRGIADRSPSGFAGQAARIVDETGAQAVKIAPFDGFRWDRCSAREASILINEGLDRISAVRKGLPSDTRVLVDCHARFNPFLARDLFKELGRLGIYWVEEPCDMTHLSAQEQRSLRSMANNHGLMLAGAETVTHMSEMDRVLQDEGHDVVLPDLRMTGIAPGVAMLRLAASRQVFCSLHNPVGPVLDAASIQVAACLPSFLILERQIGESSKFNEIQKSPVQHTGGIVSVPNLPGLGVVPDPNAMEPLGSNEIAGALSFKGMAGAGPDA